MSKDILEEFVDTVDKFYKLVYRLETKNKFAIDPIEKILIANILHTNSENNLPIINTTNIEEKLRKRKKEITNNPSIGYKIINKGKLKKDRISNNNIINHLLTKIQKIGKKKKVILETKRNTS